MSRGETIGKSNFDQLSILIHFTWVKAVYFVMSQRASTPPLGDSDNNPNQVRVPSTETTSFFVPFLEVEGLKIYQF